MAAVQTGASFNHLTYTFNNGDLTFNGYVMATVGTPGNVYNNPPFNDPFKNRHSKRYKWKHGLLGKSYLER